jgi:hypothetical protein
MAVPFLPILAGLQQNLVGAKLQAVQAGEKTVKPPKTVFGKLIGRVTGRTQAAELQKSLSSSSASTSNTTSAMPIPVNQVGAGISGSLQFGQQQQQASLPRLALIGAVLISVVYFFTQKKGRRRR